MKNEKKLMQLPVDTCPKVDLCTEHYKCRNSWKKPKGHIYTAREYDNAGEMIIIITVFSGEGAPIFRIFQGQRQFFNQFFDSEKVSTARLNYLMYGDYKCKDLYGPYATIPASKDLVLRFLGGKGDPIECLCKYQERILKQKLKERHDKIRKSVDDVMLLIRELPKDFNKWIEDVPLVHSRYIFYEYCKGRVYMNGYCTVCKTDVKVKKPKHNTKGKCPYCGKAITYKAVKISKSIVDEARCSYIQKLPNGYVIRLFNIKKYYHNKYRQPELWVHEYGREFYTVENSKRYIWDNFRQTGEYRFCETWDRLNDYCHIYGKNLRCVFKDENSSRKYFPFGEFLRKSGPVYANNFLKEIIRIKQLEYLAKLRLYRLSADIVNRGYSDLEDIININGQNPQEVIRIDKNDLPVIQAMNMDSDEIKLFSAARRYGIKEAKEAINWFRQERKKIRVTDIVNVLKYTTPYKAARYVDEQLPKLNSRYSYSPKYHLWQDWNDYISNCILLEYNMKNKFVLFPRDLKAAHDEAYELVNKMEKGIGFPVIAKMENQLNNMYGYKNKEFLIRAPHDHKEIITEGQKLKHCVSTYAKKMAKGETVILFIRRMSEPDKPFYTLECRDGEVEQCRGQSNKSMTDDVKRFVELWKARILKSQLKHAV